MRRRDDGRDRDPRPRIPVLQVVALAAGLLAAAPPRAMAGDVFVSGSGYNTYRIPAIVRAPNGTLLAFCEGRPSSSDTGNIDIVLKRSTNNGASWGSLTVVRDEGGDSATNPSPVVDETTGRIFLHYSKSITRPFYMYSDDNGATWSAPVEITATAKAPGWGYCVPGPGHGIQLKRGNQAGRLLVPSHHYLANGTKGMHAVYSDDHGATWSYGSVADAAGGINPDECMAVELVSPAPDGGSRVYYNIRDQSGSAAGNRTVGWSDDGGATLNLPLSNDTRFVTPIVQGSLLRMRATDEGDAVNVILFSCPNHASSRQNMSIWYSTDEGLNWSAPRSVYSGGAAYSDMVLLEDRTVGLLYEKNPYSRITFTSFSPDFLGLGATWDATNSIGWGTAGSWLTNVTPTFNNRLDVWFCDPATTRFAINIGSAGVHGINRTIRSLNFNANADNNVTIELQSANVSGTLTFDTDAAGGNAALTVGAGSAGSHIVGINNFGSIVLADNMVVTHNGSGTLTLGRPITETGGARSITKDGAGEMALSGANSFTGGLVINRGKLALNSTGSDDNVPDVTLGAAGTLSLGNPFAGGTATIGNLTGSGRLDPQYGSTTGTRTLQVNQADNTSFSGLLTDATSGAARKLAMVKAGGGGLTLYGPQSYTGATTINHGTLTIARNYLGAASTSASSGITVNTGATLRFFDHSYQWNFATPPIRLDGGVLFHDAWQKNCTVLSGGAVTVDSASEIVTDRRYGGGSGPGIFLDGGLQGAAPLTISSMDNGLGVVLRNANSTYGGAMTVNGSAATTPGAGSGLAAGVHNGSNASLPDADLTVNGTLELGDHDSGMGWANHDSSGLAFQMGVLAGAGVVVANMNTAASTRTLSLGHNNGSGSFSGLIADGANNTLNLVKTGAGTQTLTGVNTYTGPTAVDAGTLMVNAPGSLAAAGNVTVAAGATLGGSGTVGGSVAVSGTLAPGASTGTLTAGDVTFEPGSTFEWELADWTGDTPGTHWDLLDAASLTFHNTPSGKLTIRIDGPAANFSESRQTFPIATVSGGITGFDPAAIVIEAPGFPGAGTWSVRRNGNTIELQYPAPFADWIAGFEVGARTGFADDFDCDGLGNGLENLLGTHPAVPNTGLTAVANNGAALTFRHPHNAAPARDIGANYQWSTDLVVWRPSGARANGATVTITPAPGTPAPGATTVTATATGGPLPRLFVRLMAIRSN